MANATSSLEADLKRVETRPRRARELLFPRLEVSAPLKKTNPATADVGPKARRILIVDDEGGMRGASHADSGWDRPSEGRHAECNGILTSFKAAQYAEGGSPLLSGIDRTSQIRENDHMIVERDGSEIELSIVATVFNDREIVSQLVDEIEQHCAPLNVPYEIILVDDGSSDGSSASIAEACRTRSRVSGIGLARNYGQQIAMSAGIHESRGRYTLIMDGDLQQPAKEIPRLYRTALEGYDIVYTVSKTRNGPLDTFTSWAFWTILTRALKVSMTPHQLMMKIMSRRFVDAFSQYDEMMRIISGITADIGGRSAILEVDNQKRASGRSHYTFLQRIELCLDIFFSLSSRPLNAFIYIGLASFMMSMLLTLYYIIQFFFNTVPAGYTSRVVVELMLGGLTIAALGIIARYFALVYNEVRRRPLYFVTRRYPA